MPDQAALVDDLNETVFPLNGVEPTSNRADLAPLVDIIGEARIVGLGEATHGTHEFMMMSSRIVRMLVEEHGFKVLAFEAPWAHIEIVDQYVQGELDDPAVAKEELFYWTISTQEVWGLIEWLRDYNANLDLESRVHVAGFDPQTNTEPAIEMVLAYIGEVDPASIEAFATHYAIVNDYLGARPALKAAQAAYNTLSARRSRYASISSSPAFDQALQAARVIVQQQELQITYNESAPIDAPRATWLLRDQFMASNVGWLLEQTNPEARIALWGHNGHVATCENSAYSGLTSMGGHLRALLGIKYVAVGYGFAEGSFTSTMGGANPSQATYRAADPLPTAYAYVFRELDAPVFLLGAAQVDPASRVGTWLNAEHHMWSIGHSYDPSSPYLQVARVQLSECFDALIFFQETTASTDIE